MDKWRHALSEPKLREWIGLIKEAELNCKQSGGILEKLGDKNYQVLYRELKSVETKYLQVWNKFQNNSAYAELFLGNSAFLSVLYLELDKLDKQITIGTRSLHSKQIKILRKRLKIERENGNTNYIFKERNRLSDEKDHLYNKKIHEEIDLLLPESLSQSRSELKIARKGFLQSWKRYMKNPTFEKEFIKFSNNYAQKLLKVTTLQTKIKNWNKTKPYNKMLQENHARYYVLRDKLMAGKTFV